MRKWVLWGHHVDDYRDMFDLSSTDLSSSLLEFGCGPSGVNAELRHIAASVVSCDNLFCFSEEDLFNKTMAIFEDRRKQIENSASAFNFSRYGSLEELVATRRGILAKFFADYAQGKKEGRYVGLHEEKLPFTDYFFDLALSAHYLFADNDKQDVEHQVALIRELARVAKEVRIFPLIDYQGNPSPLLGPVLLRLQQEQYGIEVRDVRYCLQPAGHAMLRVWALGCDLGTKEKRD